ncbi:MAG: DNA alkylation repair protein [Actinobacteria bacterium]|nr:DNA alkylation repair protein [Actinomycetota bacterium]
MSDIIQKIRNDLKEQADSETKSSFQRSFKEEVKYHGVKSATVVEIAKKYFSQVKELAKEELFSLCEELFISGYGEESWIAANWLYWYEDYAESDFKVYEQWIDKYIDDWAKCDTLCNHTVGAFIEKYPEYVEELKRWAKSRNRWLKRASAVSLILPARRGEFLPDILEIADILLNDQDDMVQKGYGWMLKEASRMHQKEVFEYVLKHKNYMPRTALRYAIEKMPAELKKEAMKK